MKTKMLLSSVSAVFLVVKLLILLQLASGSLAPCNGGESADPLPPDCFDDCEGRRFFLDRDDLCKMCVQCEPGYEHDKYCGDGENGDALCVPCPTDHYSYNRYDCVACRLCENTVIDQECSLSTDRLCGDCLPGFYKDPQNPDLCNQKCEKVSDPRLIPACKVWLEHQQETTQLAPITSWMSSRPLYPDDETRGVSMTVIIIIILLIVVLIGGSVIPLYVCCKHCRHDKKSNSETILEHIETPKYSDQSQHREDHEWSDSDSIGGIVIVANSHTGAEATEPITDPLVRAGQVQTEEQTQRGGSGESVEDDKDCEKTVLEAFHSANEINFRKGSSTFQRDEHGNSEIPSSNVNETGSDRKVIDGLMENGNSSSDFPPFLNSHCRNSGKSPLEISEDQDVSDIYNYPSSSRRLEQDAVNGPETSDGRSPVLGLEFDVAPSAVGGERDEEGNSRDAEPDENQTLLSDAALQSISSTVIGLDEDNIQVVSPDLDGAQRNNVRQGFEENDGKQEELELLLPEPESNHLVHGEAKQKSLSGLADAEKPHPMNRKDCSSRSPQTLRSKEDSGEAEDLMDGEDNEVGVDNDEHQRPLSDKQEEKSDGGASGDDEWKGSAEEERTRPTNGEGKDAPLEMNFELPAQHGSNGQSQKLILNINGAVTNLVIGNQTHNYNNAGPPQ